MASSWDKLRADQKMVSLLETLAKNQGDETSISCPACNHCSPDSKSFINHCRSHLNEDGTLKPGITFASSVSSENRSNFFPNSTRMHPVSSNFFPNSSRRHPVSVNVGDNKQKNESVSQNPPNLSFASNYVVPTRLQNSVQLRGPMSSQMSQSYQSPAMYLQGISRGKFFSDPESSSNSHSGFGSQPTGGPNYRFPAKPTASAFPESPPIQESNFGAPISTGPSAFSSHSVPDTTDHVRRLTTRSLMKAASQDAVEGPLTGYTKPYIQQLEQPLEEIMVVGRNDEGFNNNNPDEMDLDLKL